MENNFEEFKNEEKDIENTEIELMEKNVLKVKRWGYIMPVITAVLGVVIGALCMNLYNQKEFLEGVEDLYSKVGTMKYILDNEYLYDYDPEKIADGAALGMTLALEEPYSIYYPKEQFAEFYDAGNGDFVGIGVVVVNNIENGTIEVESVVKGGPAEKAGVMPGDRLFSVEGVEYIATTFAEAVAAVRGEEGTEVNITVLRNNEPIDMKIMREKIHTDSVESKIAEGDIGYIKISEFNSTDGENPDTYQEFKTHYEKLREQGAKKLIIDLRDNGGGELVAVSGIVDMLVPKGNIMYTEDKHGYREYIKSDAEETDMEMVVIVNGNSASASELMTGALKDYKKATVVGTKTYGKGVMQRSYPFTDGSGVVVTIAKYYTPGGTCVQDEGITPDIVVEMDENSREDLQMAKALEILR